LTLNASATVRYVNLSSANPLPPYDDWSIAATNIQDAVAVSDGGDTVLVTNGMYSVGGAVIYGQETNRVALTNAITLLSVNGPQATRILGGTQTRCVYVGSNSVLSGFTLTNGHARTSGDVTNEQSGGGIWCENGGMVTNCVVAGNSTAASGRGGGIYGGTVYDSTLTNNVAGFGGAAALTSLFNCTLVTNSAPYSPPFGYGGGVYRGTLSNCTLIANGWGYGVTGGGAYQSTLYHCTLLTNSASYGGGAAYGSALYNCTLRGNSGGATYQCVNSNCTITANQGPVGGGTSQGTNYNCALTGNFAYELGGGASQGTLYNCVLSGNVASNLTSIDGKGGGAHSATLYNCLIVSNRAFNVGGGAYASTLYNCTVVGNAATNTGGGVYSNLCYNCIIYFNSAPSGSNYFAISGQLMNCCTAPFPNGSGSFTNAPSFVNVTAGDFHEQTNSPSINGGFNLGNLPSTDLDGNPRIVGYSVDVGAYEYQGPDRGLPIPIPWLRNNGLPTDGSANYADTDGDGMNNWQEWIAGTNPRDASSALRLLSPVVSPSGATVTWQSVGGKSYFLQRAGDLGVQPAFQTLSSNILGQAGTTSYPDTNSLGNGPFVYRVGVQ
jgi:hypothetical protein